MGKKLSGLDSDLVSRVMKAMGKKGGEVTGKRIKAGILPVTGAAVPKPTKCARCGKLQPSARAAWVHCRKPRKGKIEDGEGKK